MNALPDESRLVPKGLHCDTVAPFIGLTLSTLYLLETQPSVQQYTQAKPQAHRAIRALSTAVAQAGGRVRDTAPHGNMFDQHMEMFTAEEFWMFDLAIDVIAMFAAAGGLDPDTHALVIDDLQKLDKNTLLHRHRPDRCVLRQPGHPPALPARQPAPQPRQPHGRRHPAPPPAQRRPQVLRQRRSPKAKPAKKLSASNAGSATRATPAPAPTPGHQGYIGDLPYCWRVTGGARVDLWEPGNTTDLAEEVGTAMYETDPDDRFEAALRLSEDDPVRGAGALDRIVTSNEYDADVRFEAALRLSEVDPVRAVSRLRGIVASDEFDRDTRDEAAHRLSELELA